jgi:CBS domain-containing protein
VDEVCSHDPVSLGPDDAVAKAAKLMSERAIRRLPIVDNGSLVGIVSLGDLALDRDPNSVLGEISEAPPNN